MEPPGTSSKHPQPWKETYHRPLPEQYLLRRVHWYIASITHCSTVFYTFAGWLNMMGRSNLVGLTLRLGLGIGLSLGAETWKSWKPEDNSITLWFEIWGLGFCAGQTVWCSELESLNFSMFHMDLWCTSSIIGTTMAFSCVSCETCPIFKWVSGLSIEYYVLLHWKMKAMVSKESPTQASIATSHGLNIINDSPEDVIFGKTWTSPCFRTC